MKKIKVTAGVYLHREKHQSYLVTTDENGIEYRWRLKAGEDGGLGILLSSTDGASSLAILPHVANQLELRPRGDI